MQERRGSLSLQRMLPVFDFFLLLMLMIFGTAGLKQVLAPSEFNGSAALSQGLQRNEGPAQAGDIGAGADRREIENLRRTLEDLENQQAALLEELGSLARTRDQAADSQEALQKIARQNEDLQKEIAALGASRPVEGKSAIKVESTPLANLATRRSPVHVALVDGTVAPLREPFYSITLETAPRGEGRFESVMKASRKRTGESAKESLAAGSAFLKLLDEIDPRNQYVAFLVDSASFESFRSLRDVLRKRGIPLGWEPTRASTIYFSPAGQVIGEDS